MLTDQTEQIAADHVLGNERYRLLGARLHELRRMHGLSLKAVADAVNVSPSFLSMVERGQTDLSLSRFTRLTEFYKVLPSELLLELDSNYHQPEISHVTDFQAFDRGAGVEYHVLLQSGAHIVHTKLDPGSSFNEMRAHRGSDLWIVVIGRARLHYGRSSFDLSAGQTARFSATVPHGVSNPFDAITELIAIGTVPYW